MNLDFLPLGRAWRASEGATERQLPLTWRRSDFDAAGLLCLIVALWLATRPYYGVVADARFYTVQALHRLYPGRFADDLYFHYGTTDRFSIFAPLYAPIVARLGVAAAGMACTLAAQALWLGGLLYLAQGFLGERRLVLWSVAALIALPSGYSHYGYGEPFLTPRLLAEALTMISLGLLLRCRAAWAFVLLAAAAAIHPLMTLPGVAVAVVYLALDRPAWWLAIGVGVAAVAGLSLAGVAPFTGLRATFDPAWFAIARARDGQWLLTAWSAADDLQVLGIIALAIMALALAGAEQRRLLRAALLVAIGGVLCTLLGADLAHDVLIAQLLPWRSTWLLTLLAQLCAAIVLMRLWQEGAAARAVAAAFLTALGCLILSRFIAPLVFVTTPLLIVTATLAIWRQVSGRPLPAVGPTAARLATAAALAAALLFAYEFVVVMRPLPGELWRRVYACVLVVAGLAAVSLVAKGYGRHPAWACGLVLTAAALVGWDVRAPWTRFVEANAAAPPQLAALLPPTASVYWEGGVEMLWLRLQRGSYFSCAQGTGAVFFRAAAIAFRQRADGFWPLRTLDFDDPECRRHEAAAGRTRTAAALRETCRHEPGLDRLVLIRPVDGITAKTWQSPVPFRWVTQTEGRISAGETTRFYIYSCAALR